MTLKSIMKAITKITSLLILLLLAISLGVYLFQDKLVFQSVALSKDHQFQFNQSFEEYFVKSSDNTEINVLWFKTNQRPKGLVVYFHGNANNLQRWGNYAINITQLGYDVVMMDYRGYGKSEGQPSEQALYDDAALIWNWAKEKSDAGKMVIYGRSLGAAVAAHLAAETQPDLLVLETPFDELKNANTSRYLFAFVPLRSKFNTKEVISKVPCKTVIFQGTDDWVVNLKSAERLKSMLKATDEFVTIPGGSHNDLSEFPLYHTRLAAILR